MAVTLGEIAVKSGVSTSLVSRVLRDDDSLRVSDSTRQRVLRIASEMGGLRRRESRRSKTFKSRVRTVIVPVNRSFSGDIFQQTVAWNRLGGLFETFDQTLREHDCRMNVTFFDPASRMDEFRQMVQTRGVCDGVLLSGAELDEPLASLLRHNRFPHVCIHHPDAIWDIPAVGADHFNGARKIIRHLVDLGHRRIGFFGLQRTNRYATLVGAMSEFGLVFDAAEPLVCANPEAHRYAYGPWVEQVRPPLVKWLKQRDRPTALVCQNDHFASLALLEAQRQGVRPGRDLSITSYGVGVPDVAMSESQPCQLTTIDDHFSEVGKRAAEVLVRQIETQEIEYRCELLPVELVTGDTTGPV